MGSPVGNGDDDAENEAVARGMVMLDPWAPPTSAQLEQLRTAVTGPSPPWQQQPRMTLRSVPDARTAVASVWWMPVVAVLMLGATTVAILPGGSSRGVLVATAVSLVGYALVWWRIRPSRLRVGPHSWPSIEAVAQDRTDPPTLALPTISVTLDRRGRVALLLLNSAAVGLGASIAWSVITNLLIRPTVPAGFRSRPAMRTVGGALANAVVNAAITSVLEECGIAVLILAVAGLAQRFLPARFDTRSVAVLAIVAATSVRTVLHIPLWGVGAVARIGLSFGLAWLFWRTRRIWPLLAVHILWDTLSLQTLTSPSRSVRGWCALTVLCWGISGVVIAVIALARSRTSTGRSGQYYRRSTARPGQFG